MKHPRFTRYLPSEVAKITGYSTDRQRELRHRGLMPLEEPGKGWTNFIAHGLAALSTMKVAANAGVPLNLAKRVGELAAPHVVYLAGEKIGGDCFEFIREKISSAQRYIFIDDDSRPNLEDDIYDFFGGDSRGAVTITIDLAFVAATLVERTTDKPIVSETSAAKRPHEK